MVVRGKPTKETLRHIYLTIRETIKKNLAIPKGSRKNESR